MPETTPTPEPSKPHGLVERGLDLVAGTQTWKRAGILMMLGFSALGAVMLYQHPEWIEAHVSGYGEPELVSVDQIKIDVPHLREGLGAEMVAVFATHVSTNEQWLIAYDTAKDLTDTVNTQIRERFRYANPLMSDESPWNPILVELLNGSNGCYPLGDAFIQTLLPKPIVTVCAVGIPPGPDALVGWIAAGFVNALDRPEATRVRAGLREQALRWQK